jgi:hypothetical protein
MAVPTWALDSFDGTSYIFFLAANPKLKLVGWITAFAQLLAILTVGLVLEEDNPSSACDNSTAFKCTTLAFVICLALFCVFTCGWLTLKASRAALALKNGAPFLGIMLGLVVCESAVACMAYAIREAASAGAQKLILDSVSVLLILDLDDKVYEAMSVLLGADKLQSWLGFEKVEPLEDAKAEEEIA